MGTLFVKVKQKIYCNLRIILFKGCKIKLESKGCPSCNRSVEGRNIALGKILKNLTIITKSDYRKNGKIIVWRSLIKDVVCFN